MLPRFLSLTMEERPLFEPRSPRNLRGFHSSSKLKELLGALHFRLTYRRNSQREHIQAILDYHLADGFGSIIWKYVEEAGGTNDNDFKGACSWNGTNKDTIED